MNRKLVRILVLVAAMLAVFTALMLVVGWPALATVLQFIQDLRTQTPSTSSLRPLRLGIETLKLVGLTELISLPLGVLAGFIVFRTDALGHRLLLGLIGISLFVPMPLHALAWLGSFGNAGRSQAFGNGPILTGLFGAAFVHAMAALPWVAVISGVGMRTVERELEETALLDLPAWNVFFKVTLRRSLGAIAGAALAVAVLTAGDMTITDLLQVRTFAEESYLRAQLGMGQGAAAAAVTFPMFLIFAILIGLASRALFAIEPERLPSAEVSANPYFLGRWRVGVGLAAWCTAGTLVGLPVYGLIWRTGWVGRLGQQRHWSPIAFVKTLGASWTELTTPITVGPFFETLTSQSLFGSLYWATIAACGSVALAWSLCWLSRDSRFWRILTGLAIAMALAAPGPVAGVALKLAYLRVPFINDTSAILILAYVLRSFPYAILLLWPSIRGLSSEHLESAAVDGLSFWGRAWKIGLPLTRSAILAAWIASLVLSLGELPSSYFVAPPGYKPLSLLVWGMLHTGVESHLAGIGLILVTGVSIIGMMAVYVLSRAFPG